MNSAKADQKYQNNKKDITFIYGGSFDPPHIGHVAFVTALAHIEDCREVWVLPSYRHPFGKKMATFQHRLAMAQEAFAEISPKIKIKNDEKNVDGSGYTIDIVRHLHEKYPKESFVLALGADNYSIRHKWKDFDEIENLIKVAFFGRKGWNAENEALGLDTPFPEVCSSKLRRELSEGTIDKELLPPQIVEYIQHNRLYLT